jgi:hypothetical protein
MTANRETSASGEAENEADDRQPDSVEKLVAQGIPFAQEAK